MENLKAEPEEPSCERRSKLVEFVKNFTIVVVAGICFSAFDELMKKYGVIGHAVQGFVYIAALVYCVTFVVEWIDSRFQGIIDLIDERSRPAE